MLHFCSLALWRHWNANIYYGIQTCIFHKLPRYCNLMDKWLTAWLGKDAQVYPDKPKNVGAAGRAGMGLCWSLLAKKNKTKKTWQIWLLGCVHHKRRRLYQIYIERLQQCSLNSLLYPFHASFACYTHSTSVGNANITSRSHTHTTL